MTATRRRKPEYRLGDALAMRDAALAAREAEAGRAAPTAPPSTRPRLDRESAAAMDPALDDRLNSFRGVAALVATHAMITAGWRSSSQLLNGEDDFVMSDHVARDAVGFADALIAELDRRPEADARPAENDPDPDPDR